MWNMPHSPPGLWCACQQSRRVIVCKLAPQPPPRCISASSSSTSSAQLVLMVCVRLKSADAIFLVVLAQNANPATVWPGGCELEIACVGWLSRADGRSAAVQRLCPLEARRGADLPAGQRINGVENALNYIKGPVLRLQRPGLWQLGHQAAGEKAQHQAVRAPRRCGGGGGPVGGWVLASNRSCTNWRCLKMLLMLQSTSRNGPA